MSSPEETKGFVAPMHHSLLAIKMFAGVPSEYMLLNMGAGFILMNYITIYFFVLTISLHVAGIALAKKDRYFMGVFSQYLKQSKFYD